MVDQATEILTILDPRRLCVDADIYERDIARVRLGQRVDVPVPAYPDLVFKGMLKHVGDVLKEETRTVTVRTEVENEGRRLKPGMFATLDIVLEENSRALTVPVAAVLDDGLEEIVFIRKDGEFLRRGSSGRDPRSTAISKSRTGCRRARTSVQGKLPVEVQALRRDPQGRGDPGLRGTAGPSRPRRIHHDQQAH